MKLIRRPGRERQRDYAQLARIYLPSYFATIVPAATLHMRARCSNRAPSTDTVLDDALRPTRKSIATPGLTLTLHAAKSPDFHTHRLTSAESGVEPRKSPTRSKRISRSDLQAKPLQFQWLYRGPVQSSIHAELIR